jgi:hypothetical protein
VYFFKIQLAMEIFHLYFFQVQAYRRKIQFDFIKVHVYFAKIHVDSFKVQVYLRLDTTTQTEIQQAFDDDYLSSARITGAKTGILFDFENPVPKITSIECMAPNDENHIYPNNYYELLYCDADKWISLGKKTADNYHIVYDRVPSGALYWLRNLTKGKEERIFTYDHHHVRFW